MREEAKEGWQRKQKRTRKRNNKRLMNNERRG